MALTILAASYTDKIYTLSFDSLSNTLECVATSHSGPNPSWIERHPKHPTHVYACLEDEEAGQIVLLKYDESYLSGTVLAQCSTAGSAPCHIHVSEDELFAANYGSGSAFTIPILPQSPYFLAPSNSLQFTGSGPNQLRQEASHAHQTVLIATNGVTELLVPDLGGDRVYRCRKNSEGIWTVYGHVQYPAGSGPRHVVFYNGVLYTLLELRCEVAFIPYDSSCPPSPIICEHITSTMKSHPQSYSISGGEILITNTNATFAEPFVYTSNRDCPPETGDTISILAIEEGGVKLIAEFSTGLKHLRGMQFGGPDDKWLIAAGSQGGGVKVFERVDGGIGFCELASVDVEKVTGFLWV